MLFGWKIISHILPLHLIPLHQSIPPSCNTKFISLAVPPGIFIVFLSHAIKACPYKISISFYNEVRQHDACSKWLLTQHLMLTIVPEPHGLHSHKIMIKFN